MGACQSSPNKEVLVKIINTGNATATVSYMERKPQLLTKRTLEQRQTVWHVAAQAGQLKVLEAMVEFGWAKLPDEAGGLHPDGVPPGKVHPAMQQAMDAHDMSGATALMLACHQGHSGAVEVLLNQGASPVRRDMFRGRTALHYAVLKNHLACLQTILEHPSAAAKLAADGREYNAVDMPNHCGYTPLHYAAATNQPSAAAMLVSHGADLGVQTRGEGMERFTFAPGNTALHLCAHMGALDVAIEILLQYAEHQHAFGVADPRNFENSQGLKPYQLLGMRSNRSLQRVLDPKTPLKEISDPFGTDGKLSRNGSPSSSSSAMTRCNSGAPDGIFRGSSRRVAPLPIDPLTCPSPSGSHAHTHPRTPGGSSARASNSGAVAPTPSRLSNAEYSANGPPRTSASGVSTGGGGGGGSASRRVTPQPCSRGFECSAVQQQVIAAAAAHGVQIGSAAGSDPDSPTSHRSWSQGPRGSHTGATVQRQRSGSRSRRRSSLSISSTQGVAPCAAPLASGGGSGGLAQQGSSSGAEPVAGASGAGPTSWGSGSLRGAAAWGDERAALSASAAVQQRLAQLPVTGHNSDPEDTLKGLARPPTAASSKPPLPRAPSRPATAATVPAAAAAAGLAAEISPVES